MEPTLATIVELSEVLEQVTDVITKIEEDENWVASLYRRYPEPIEGKGFYHERAFPRMDSVVGKAFQAHILEFLCQYQKDLKQEIREKIHYYSEEL